MVLLVLGGLGLSHRVETVSLPEQRDQWIPVREFMPLFDQQDNELERVMTEILKNKIENTEGL